MDLRLLQYFTAVAELEHVGKASERLRISQSPLSRQIRQLEKELDLELFVRERQRIRLTESGRWLLSEARDLLAHAAKIREEARRRALGATGTLSIAFVSRAIWSGVLPQILRRFQADFPDVQLELRNMRSSVQMDALEGGRVDIGFLSMASTGNALETTCVSEEPFLLVLPGAHPLSRKRTVTPGDLDGARWILLSDAIAPERRARFLAGCGNLGFVPQVVQEVTEPNTLLGLVESGFGVALIENSARKCAPRALKFQELPWLPFRSRTYMVRRVRGRQPLADSFAGYVSKVNIGS